MQQSQGKISTDEREILGRGPAAESALPGRRRAWVVSGDPIVDRGVDPRAGKAEHEGEISISRVCRVVFEAEIEGDVSRSLSTQPLGSTTRLRGAAGAKGVGILEIGLLGPAPAT